MFHANTIQPCSDSDRRPILHRCNRPLWSVLTGAGVGLLLAPIAQAQTVEPPASPELPPSQASPPRDRARDEGWQDRWKETPRPWLYAADPTGPAHLHVLASLAVGYAQTDRGAARPFAADVAHAGAVWSANAEVGLTRYASISAEGMLAGQAETGSPISAGTMIGATAFPLGGRAPVDLAVSAGYLRELGGANGVWARAGIAGDLGPARLALTGLAEHVFEENRDGVDILLTSGASFSLPYGIRLGAEYVVQDLEGAWEEEEADGGIRHFVGASASIVIGDHVQLAVGPAFGLSPGSPNVLGRMTATYAF